MLCGRRCGIFETGFAGTFYDPAYWRSVLEVTADGNFSTAPLLWPVLSTPVGAERADMPYYILHYTYGIEYSAEGLPMELQAPNHARQSCAHRMAATA